MAPNGNFFLGVVLVMVMSFSCVHSRVIIIQEDEDSYQEILFLKFLNTINQIFTEDYLQCPAPTAGLVIDCLQTVQGKLFASACDGIQERRDCIHQGFQQCGNADLSEALYNSVLRDEVGKIGCVIDFNSDPNETYVLDPLTTTQPDSLKGSEDESKVTGENEKLIATTTVSSIVSTTTE